MLTYNDVLLKEIEEFAYLYMSREEISIITGADLHDMADAEHPACLALRKGRLRRKAEYNSAVINLTKQLSSPAMAIEHKIAESTYLNDMR